MAFEHRDLMVEGQDLGKRKVDTYGPPTDHGVCTDENTRWIEPLLPGSPAAAVHPNARGEQGMVHAVLRTLH
ncbi:hypothetical protein [Streptomyces sp. NPDC097640]|uniref:hypothetical protein n=1 Tax=Streptomyces sp. NPDC097640 TaxID=3157229 RepID=UPI00333417C6